MSKRKKKNIDRPIAYYIEGNLDRGSDVIKALKDVGGKNDANLSGETNCYYFIDLKTKVIDMIPKDCSFAYMLQLYGTKITLREKYYITHENQFRRERQSLPFHVHNPEIAPMVSVYAGLVDVYTEWISYFDVNKCTESIDELNKLGFKFPSKNIARDFYNVFMEDICIFNGGVFYDEKV